MEETKNPSGISSVNKWTLHSLHCFLSKEERCKLILLLFYNSWSRKEFVWKLTSLLIPPGCVFSAKWNSLRSTVSLSCKRLHLPMAWSVWRNIGWNTTCCNDRTLELITKVHPADLSDFLFVCRRFLAVSSRKYSILILVIHEVAVPPFRYVEIVR